jgi:hypothetical protein
MNGAPATRYVAEEEINLRTVTCPPPNPFLDTAKVSENHEKNSLEFEYIEHERINNGGSFELVPLSEEDDNEAEVFDNDKHRSSASTAPFSEDDYHTSGTMLPKSVYQYIYPPNVPRTVQLFRPENIAVPACYLLVGLLQGLSGPFCNVYPLDLNASEAQQATISSLKSLPSTFKLAFGFLSDNIPLAGYRRKSYMLIGWAVTSLSMCLLLLFSDLSMEAVELSQEENGEANNDRYLPVATDAIIGAPPSIPFLSFTLLMFGTGFWFADVMGDSIVAEKAKLEPESSRGQLQSTCYACRFFGLMVAAPFSTVIYSSYGPKAVVVLMAGLPALIVPLVYMLKETKNLQIASTKEQCSEIWSTVCSRAVWQPLGFVYLYNVLQVGNAAWKQFLKTVLGFTANQLNSLLIAAYVLLWVGIMAYKKFFITWSWRSVYISTTLLNGVLSALQVLLIKGITFGLSPFLFALGDDCFADFIGGIQFLPTTIMMVRALVMHIVAFGDMQKMHSHFFGPFTDSRCIYVLLVQRVQATLCLLQCLIQPPLYQMRSVPYCWAFGTLVRRLWKVEIYRE